MDELSTIGYLFLFLLPFLVSYFFKLSFRRPNPDQVNAHHATMQTNEEIKIKTMQNPFTINLDSMKSSSKNGLFLEVFRLNPLISYTVAIAWRVEINKFYDSIEKDYQECFYDKDKLFLSECSSKTELIKLDNKEENLNSLEFKIPDECVNLFKMDQNENKVKTVYPVVVCIYNEEENLKDLNNNDIIASIWVIHLKDTKMSSKILYNYNKCLNNQIIIINKIYEPEKDDLCCVCQTERSNVVLLPCVHKCLCKECFVKCNNKCPVCRGKIINIFHV